VLFTVHAEPCEAPTPNANAAGGGNSNTATAKQPNTPRAATVTPVAASTIEENTVIPTPPAAPIPYSWYSLVVSVCDSGIGISETGQTRLFTSFSQAHKEIAGQYGGTGLGLAISKSLVGLLGGNIGVTSTPGVGSTFSFSLRVRAQPNSQLPLHILPDHIRATAPISSTDVDSTLTPLPLTRRILLVHGNPAVSALLASMLMSWHFEVEEVRSFELFKSVWSATTPPLYHSVWFDAATVTTCGEMPYVTDVFQWTRGTSCTICALVPIGSTRRTIERVTDYILTQPCKASMAYEAIKCQQKPELVESNVTDSCVSHRDIPLAGRASPVSSSFDLSPPPYHGRTLIMTSPVLSAGVSSRALSGSAAPITTAAYSGFARSTPLRILVAEVSNKRAQIIDNKTCVVIVSNLRMRCVDVFVFAFVRVRTTPSTNALFLRC